VDRPDHSLITTVMSLTAPARGTRTPHTRPCNLLMLILDGPFSLGIDMYNYNAWQQCICGADQGTSVTTGAVQYIWNDAGFNGYSQCWNSGCDGA